MAISNSKLVDSENLVFSVLDSISLQLFGGYDWQGEDIDESTAVGSVFHAFEQPPTESVASLTVVDVSGDPDEPDISILSEEAVEKVDSLLRSAVESQMDLDTWMSSKLNEAGDLKALVTPYITKNNGKRWQYIALRLGSKGRKIVVIGMFDVAKSDPLAKLVFRSMQTVGL